MFVQFLLLDSSNEGLDFDYLSNVVAGESPVEIVLQRVNCSGAYQ